MGNIVYKYDDDMTMTMLSFFNLLCKMNNKFCVRASVQEQLHCFLCNIMCNDKYN